MRAPTPFKCLTFLVALSCLLVFALVPRYDLLDEGESPHFARGLLDPTTPAAQQQSQAPASPSAPASSPSPSPTSSPPPSSISSSPPTSQAASQSAPPSSTPAPTSNAPSSTPPASNQDSQTASQPANTPPPQESSSAVVFTGSGGERQTSIVIITQTPTDTGSSASPSSTSDNDDSGGSSGISSSTIIGISVAGGVAVIGIVAFFVWKFTRKRFSEFDDNEAIKWPDLNSHDAGVPLPTNQTGRAGFDTASEADLSRSNSRAGYASSVAATSTAELYPGGVADPYAVPPLPHMNPNQPYHDDPNGEFYDPYRGPVPQTFGEPGAEAIPMTQMAARARSPGPGMLYDNTGRASPQPSMAGRRSPGPQAAFGYGDAPPAMYGAERARSPGPGAGLGMATGRQSPGPQAAYGYGPR
ncbi:hypothetical protein DENSPDRAFT_856861 [Dentipellis sp. KUC8613]|nr:hypothetical protein DENSPDRAFT_856861 [Dentipellis sp. KUC8613]